MCTRFEPNMSLSLVGTFAFFADVGRVPGWTASKMYGEMYGEQDPRQDARRRRCTVRCTANEIHDEQDHNERAPQLDHNEQGANRLTHMWKQINSFDARLIQWHTIHLVRSVLLARTRSFSVNRIGINWILRTNLYRKSPEWLWLYLMRINRTFYLREIVPFKWTDSVQRKDSFEKSLFERNVHRFLLFGKFSSENFSEKVSRTTFTIGDFFQSSSKFPNKWKQVPGSS